MWIRRKPKSTPDPDGPDLLDWAALAEQRDWTGLLIGNGASIACWSDFNYQSLFEQASDRELGNSLDDDDIQVFDAFRTTNFEQVLAALRTAIIVSTR